MLNDSRGPPDREIGHFCSRSGSANSTPAAAKDAEPAMSWWHTSHWLVVVTGRSVVTRCQAAPAPMPSPGTEPTLLNNGSDDNLKSVPVNPSAKLPDIGTFAFTRNRISPLSDMRPPNSTKLNSTHHQFSDAAEVKRGSSQLPRHRFARVTLVLLILSEIDGFVFP